MASAVTKVTKVLPGRSVFFVCDVQTRFRNAIFGFPEMVATASKMLKSPSHEGIVTALGPTVPELPAEPLGDLHLGTIEKTLFSMATSEVIAILKERDLKSVILFGIESHVCVLQSTLDLLELGYDVHIVADGVASCNKEEVPIALARMRQAGAQITTSESVLFQLQRDSSKPGFKAFSKVIKEEKDATQQSISTLLSMRSLL
ncbi:hypothetical protein EVG20_g7913 [Dentipellis fragilis]|uniref:Isochorismatase-like domain-containing protein n=1 Tax=Dentipellis fragilis TaxID=205917 RepID=A0A4Y9YBG8_9AGAM|nr:hypothetical protein EVG20_g7913 [Dentipellis fragilis]